MFKHKKRGTADPVLYLGVTALLMFMPMSVRADTQEKIRKVILDNGLAVILVEEPKAPIITLQIWYKVGSRDEISGKTGLSHLLEHMMFKGTTRYGKGEFSRIVAKNGGKENAFTGNDYTAYFEILSSDKIGIAFDLESDRMQNLLLDQTEYLLEREVVKEERRSRTDDDPQAALVESLYATAYWVHPYHNPVIGWMNDLNHLERDAAYQHYKKYYYPGNATLVLVGDFKADNLLPLVIASFGKIPRKNEPTGANIPDEPPQKGERRITLKREAQLPFLFMGFHAPHYKDPDTYALTALAQILSGGKSSRLYQSVVYRQQLALNAGGHYDDLTTDPDLFYFYGTPRPGIALSALEDAFTQEIRRLQTEKVEEAELAKAKNQIEAEFIFQSDSSFARAMQIGRSETVGAGYTYITQYLDHLNAVTADDVLRVAQRYLVEDNRSVGTLLPTTADEGAPVR